MASHLSRLIINVLPIEVDLSLKQHEITISYLESVKVKLSHRSVAFFIEYFVLTFQ